MGQTDYEHAHKLGIRNGMQVNCAKNADGTTVYYAKVLAEDGKVTQLSENVNQKDIERVIGTRKPEAELTDEDIRKLNVSGVFDNKHAVAIKNNDNEFDLVDKKSATTTLRKKVNSELAEKLQDAAGALTGSTGVGPVGAGGGGAPAGQTTTPQYQNHKTEAHFVKTQAEPAPVLVMMQRNDAGTSATVAQIKRYPYNDDDVINYDQVNKQVEAWAKGLRHTPDQYSIVRRINDKPMSLTGHITNENGVPTLAVDSIEGVEQKPGSTVYDSNSYKIKVDYQNDANILTVFGNYLTMDRGTTPRQFDRVIGSAHSSNADTQYHFGK